MPVKVREKSGNFATEDL